MLLYALLLVAVVGCMMTLSKCDKPRAGQARAAGVASGGDTIDVAIEYSPVTYYTYDDTLGGYNYDLLRAISSVAGRPFKFHPIVSLDKGLAGIEQGIYDVLVAQFPLTSRNRDRYAFTRPIYIDQQVLVQRAVGAVHSQLDLAGDTLVVVKGSPMVERVHSLSREIGDTIYIRVDDTYGPEQLMMQVAAGEIRYAVVNKSIARYLDRRLPGVDVSVDISMSQFQSWLLRKDNLALRDSLDAWHATVKRDHKALYDNLQRRYFR